MKTYRHPRSWGWRIAIATPVWLVMGGLLIWVSTFAASLFAVPLGLLGVFGIVSPFARILMWASSVTVTDETIEAVTYARRRTRIRWEELRSVEQIHSYAFDASEFVRLVGRGAARINFADAMAGYPELMELLERRAPAVPRARLPRIWLLLLVGGVGGTMPVRSGSAPPD